ncbi:condensation domain-containing protein [Micromonospora marina]|nr:condensation domain-containing protein [Micromonospora marina]
MDRYEAAQRPTGGGPRERDRLGAVMSVHPEVELTAPLSSGQQQMWVLNQLDPGSPAYLMTCVLRLIGPLDAEALRRSWERITERHDVLRTRYGYAAHTPVQIIDPPGRFDLRQIDLGGDGPHNAQAQAERIAAVERQTSIDLTREPPLRVTLLRLAPEVHHLVLVIHHIACDDASLRQVAAEMNAWYTEYTIGTPAALPEPVTQYADYARTENELWSTGGQQLQLDFWRQRLAGLAELELPYDAPRPDRPDPRGGVVEVVIPKATATAVRDLARDRRATPSVVLLAAFHATLAQVAGSTDVAIGMPVSARTRPELDGVVGFLVNTVVIRIRCTVEQTFTELLDEVRNEAFDAFDRRDVPFTRVVDDLHPARSASGNPLFRAAFDMNRTEEDVFELAGLRVEHVPWEAEPVAKFDLNLHIVEDLAEQFQGLLGYAAAIFDESTVARIATAYQRFLTAAVAASDTTLAELWQQVGIERGERREIRVTRPVSPAVPADPHQVAEVVGRIDAAWRAALKLDRIDRQENFFDVGGDSLLAVAVAAGLRAEGLDVAAADILAHQTIDDLASVVAGRTSPPDETRPVAPFTQLAVADRALLPPDLVDAYPLAMGQLGMIIEMRARPDQCRYQDTTSFLVKDTRPLDLDALQAAAQRLVDRHEVLRTSFHMTGYSMPLQLVHPTAVITVGHTEHGTMTADDWRPALLDYAAAQRQVPFDLTKPPLLRLHAHTSPDETDWWLSMTECHPTVEGWSFHLLLMEILADYRALREGRLPIEAPPAAFRFADHIAAESAALRSAPDREYWRGVLEGRVPAEVPYAWQGDHNEPDERYQHLVPFRDIEDELRQLAVRTRTSLKAVLLAAHLKVLSTVTDTDNFVTGLVCDARPEMIGAERVPGMYVNTVPFAIPDGARTWGELISAVHQELARMWPHRRLPLQVIQQDVRDENRLFDIIFSYLDFHHVDHQQLGWDSSVTETDNEFALHVFTITGLVKINTTTHLLSRDNAVRLGEIYRHVLEQMCAGPDGDALAPCLPPGEVARIAAAGQAGSDEEPRPALDLLAAHVAEQPDAPAVCDAEGSLTYRELDAAADRVAEQLCAAGVSPGSLIAVAGPVSHRLLLVAMIGVWKTSSCWVPVELSARGVCAVISPADGAAGLQVTTTGGGDRRIGTAACVLPTGDRSDGPGVVISHRALAFAMAGSSTTGGIRPAVGPRPWWRIMADVLLLLAPANPLAPDQSPASRPTAADLSSPVEPVGAGRSSALGSAETAGWAIVDGRPLPGLAARVLDRQRREVPVGVVGELWLSGPALADGYLDDPAGTAEKFRPEPGGASGCQMFQTGQLALMRADGTIEHLGTRMASTTPDGRTLDLARVRAKLCWLASGAEVVVALRGEQVTAYLHSPEGIPLETAELRRRLAHLPRRLVPKAIVQVDGWPRTATGALDLEALPVRAPAQGTSPSASPWDERFESMLRALLPSLPAGEELSPDAELSALGLDSLGTVELLSVLEDAYNIEIPDELLAFETFATARTLWAHIVQLQAVAGVSA